MPSPSWQSPDWHSLESGSSLRIACDLVRAGDADAVVSAGNSGAVLAMGMFVLKRIPGVDRPAIVAVFPTTHGGVAMLDAGANVDCEPELLRQFAVMGAVFAEICLDRPRPRVGLLSNGEEDEKGNDQVRAAHKLIGVACPWHHHRPGGDRYAAVVNRLFDDFARRHNPLGRGERQASHIRCSRLVDVSTAACNRNGQQRRQTHHRYCSSYPNHESSSMSIPWSGPRKARPINSRDGVGGRIVPRMSRTRRADRG